MLRSNDFLRPCLQTLKRVTGARAVSLYLPAAPGGTPGAILLHEGEPPIAELADLPAAEECSCRIEAGRNGGDDSEGDVFLRSYESASAGGRILRVSTPETLLSRLHAAAGDAAAVPARRKSDRSPSSSQAPAIWMGLALDDGADLAWPAALDGPGDPSTRWTWALGLSATLAWHAQQVGAVLNDPVSRLPGRHQFQANLLQAVDRAKARGRCLVLVLINPHDFVVVNENFGREAGDAVISEIAERLRGSIRSSDLIGRYGGAVFSLALLDTEPDVGRLVAEKLRRRLTEGAYLNGTVRLGFGCGVAAFDPATEGAAEPLELIRQADRALNLAKQSSEGRVVDWHGDAATSQVGTLDRLSGIFTANVTKDYRNMLFLWDTVNIVSTTSDFDALAARVVERLHATFKAERVLLFGWSQERGFLLVEGKSRNGVGADEDAADPLRLGDAERRLLDTARHSGDTAAVGLAGEGGAERLCCAVPMISRERCLGCLYVEDRDDSKSFDRSDLLFLKALAGQLAVTLDRSELAAQERALQERERRRLHTELKELRKALQETRLVYRSAEMETLVTLLRRLAPTDATLLITGESGTGKELLARTAHALSERRKQPFVVVDCGAIAAPLIERELFGHEKGAFTSAEKSGVGRLAEADGGTLVLDEIGELPLEVQTRFLRFAQEKQFTPVGGTRTRKVDVRLIAVTNRDLEQEVAAGRFRADLFYRLNVAPLVIPPLRERPDDVTYLARHFLRKFSVQYQKGVRRLSPQAEERLAAHAWPGNVRELQNRIMRAVILCEGEQIEPADLELEAPPRSEGGAPGPPRLPSAAAGLAAPGAAEASRHETISAPQAWEALDAALGEQIEVVRAGATPIPLGRWLAEDLVLEAHSVAGGVMKRAAGLLGLPETTFRRKLRKAETEAALAQRPPNWDAVRTPMSGLLRALASADDGAERVDVLRHGRNMLLEQILVRLPGDAATGAVLMGITVPTFRSWAAEVLPED